MTHPPRDRSRGRATRRPPAFGRGPLRGAGTEGLRRGAGRSPEHPIEWKGGGGAWGRRGDIHPSLPLRCPCRKRPGQELTQKSPGAAFSPDLPSRSRHVLPPGPAMAATPARFPPNKPARPAPPLAARRGNPPPPIGWKCGVVPPTLPPPW